MSRRSKLIVGLLSFLPIILLLVFFVMLLATIPEASEWKEYGHPATEEVFRVFGPIFILIIIIGLLSLGLLVFFIMHLIRNKNMDTTERVVWILVLFFAGILGYPIYWYMRIWKDQPGHL